jgi:hypothetical protein
VGKPEGKSPLGRPRHRWMDNIKMDLREIELDCMEWIDLSQDMDRYGPVEGSYEHGNESSGSVECWVLE